MLLPLTGCGITEPAKKSERHLYRLQLGDNPADVQNSLGTADRVRGTTKTPEGHLLELYEYAIYPNYRSVMNALLCPLTLTLSCWFPGGKSASDPYWLQFVDGKLEKWGRAGDWQADISADLTVRQK